jgi:hypothetical protein
MGELISPRVGGLHEHAGVREFHAVTAITARSAPGNICVNFTRPFTTCECSGRTIRVSVNFYTERGEELETAMPDEVRLAGFCGSD